MLQMGALHSDNMSPYEFLITPAGSPLMDEEYLMAITMREGFCALLSSDIYENLLDIDQSSYVQQRQYAL
jgi:hypothetical protein